MLIDYVNLFSSRVADGPVDLELAATIYLPSLSAHIRSPGLIVGHGAGSRRGNHDEFCRQACAGGFAVLAFDFRGHGDSHGRADGPLEQDVLAAAGYLRALPLVDDQRVCYRGSSMGGFYGLKAAAATDFAALVLLCPAGEEVILDALDDRARAGRQSGAVDDDSSGGSPAWDTESLRRYFRAEDSLRLASEIAAPVLLVHARADEVVPFEHSLRLTEAFGGPATLMALPGGSHTSAQHDPQIHRLTVDWLRTCVG